MTWIKICGTTNLEDARLAVAAGADALGFIFAPSPRRVNSVAAAAIVCSLPEHIEAVGVFVNESVATICEIAGTTGISAVQLHGDEDVAFIAELAQRMPQLRIIKALPADAHLAARLQQFATATGVTRILLDHASAGLRGGSGVRFDWKAVAPIMQHSGYKEWILAGGLNPLNVVEAIETLHPRGVDVVSGVEEKPGKKAPAKVRNFVQAIRNAEKRR